MCDPITIAGAAASAAGAAASYSAQGQVADARNSVLANERAQQNVLNQEASGVNAKSVGRYDNFADNQASTASTLGDFFKTSGTAAPPSFMPASNSAATNTAVAKSGDAAKAYTDQQGGALGNLRSFGDLLATNSRGQARDASQIGQINNFKQGDANTTAYSLDAANQAGNGTAFLGNVLSGLGKVGISAGLSGGASKLGSMFGSAPTQLASGVGVMPSTVGTYGITNFNGTGVNPFSLY